MKKSLKNEIKGLIHTFQEMLILEEFKKEHLAEIERITKKLRKELNNNNGNSSSGAGQG